MTPEVWLPEAMPVPLANALRRDLRRDLEVVAAEVLAARAAHPHHHTRFAAVTPIGLYAALLGLTVARASHGAQVRAVGDLLHCYGIDATELRERAAGAFPELVESVDQAIVRSLGGGPERLMLWVAMGPKDAGVFELTIRWPAAAQGAEVP